MMDPARSLHNYSDKLVEAKDVQTWVATWLRLSGYILNRDLSIYGNLPSTLIHHRIIRNNVQQKWTKGS
jgi:hypothetical protein